jgi:hypothetical protein
MKLSIQDFTHPKTLGERTAEQDYNAAFTANVMAHIAKGVAKK